MTTDAGTDIPAVVAYAMQLAEQTSSRILQNKEAMDEVERIVCAAMSTLATAKPTRLVAMNVAASIVATVVATIQDMDRSQGQASLPTDVMVMALNMLAQEMVNANARQKAALNAAVDADSTNAN